MIFNFAKDKGVYESSIVEKRESRSVVPGQRHALHTYTYVHSNRSKVPRLKVKPRREKVTSYLDAFSSLDGRDGRDICNVHHTMV